MIREFGLKTEYKEIEEYGENKHVVRWDFKPEILRNPATGEENTDYATWMAEVVIDPVNKEQLQKLFTDYYNEVTDSEILNGYVWNDMKIYLSKENQFNYKTAYDLAIQTGGENLPFTFKFGTDEEPVYYSFTNLEELSDFYQGMVKHINSTIIKGWKKKDAIDYSVYL